jgi:hypothetical protein
MLLRVFLQGPFRSAAYLDRITSPATRVSFAQKWERQCSIPAQMSTNQKTLQVQPTFSTRKH